MNDSGAFTDESRFVETNVITASFDKEKAANAFAKHFFKANYVDSGVTYHGDFMRNVGAVESKFTSTATCSTFLFFEAETVQSSSLSEATVRLSQAALKLTYALEEAGHHREAAREVMRFIEDNLHASKLNITNNVLAEANVKRLSSRSLIALIRSSSRASEALPAWHLAYKNSWDEMKRKNKSPEALFVGMTRPREI